SRGGPRRCRARRPSGRAWRSSRRGSWRGSRRRTSSLPLPLERDEEDLLALLARAFGPEHLDPLETGAKFGAEIIELLAVEELADEMPARPEEPVGGSKRELAELERAR